MDERRPNPQQVLHAIREQDAQESHGKLKIFFGYAAGVGKTYAMLQAAHQARKNGVDVAVGYVERHTRPDTLALLDGLEQLPCKEMIYKGVSLKEFDLDAALKRNPQLLLVDELAHSNAAGCRHAKTIPGRRRTAAGWNRRIHHRQCPASGVPERSGGLHHRHIAVSERIPDRVFDSADQVELVDIEPADLIARLQARQGISEASRRSGLWVISSPWKTWRPCAKSPCGARRTV